MAQDSILISGLGCRFPNAKNIDEFWNLLLSEVDAIGPVPGDRWNIADLYDSDYRTPGHIHQKEGGFVEGIREFDPAFFKISRRESLHIDPQQRLLLECVVQAAENAGLPLAKLAGTKTGVFIGISTHDYSDIQQSASERSLISSYTNQGGSLAIAANRISYVFDLRGPSLAIDTACSSSIYALHAAVNALRSGDCDYAFVGGVNVMLKPEMTIGFSKGRFLSPTGRCKAFAKESDGYVRSEGAGIILLTKKSLAEKDNLEMLAEVVSVGLNEDGRSEGMSLPNLAAQKELLKITLGKTAFKGSEIDYVECHGTGTPAGDPIECSAIGEILGRERSPLEPCYVGSVKTNIGHLEAGSGAAGLIKLALSLSKGVIPKSLYSENLNPNIPFEKLNVTVVQKTMAWPQRTGKRIGGLNSFGFGGANAHAILASVEVERKSVEPLARIPMAVALSAKTTKGVSDLAGLYLLQKNKSLQNIAYSSFHHRDHYEQRSVVIAKDSDEFQNLLESVRNGNDHPQIISGQVTAKKPKIGLVFSGQGPQWFKMGREFLAQDPEFKKSFMQLDALFSPLLGWSVWDALHKEEAEAQMDETYIAQPTLFSLHVCLARRWQSLGVEVHGTVGHSLGEMAAAVVAGAITLEEGVQVIYHRSRLHQKASGIGRMLAATMTVAEGESYVRKYEGRVCIGAINAPDAIVFSGDNKEIQELANELESKSVFNRLLRGKVAFHSHHMNLFKDELLRCLSHLEPQETRISFYSGYMGKKSSGSLCKAEYWVDCVREPVQFMNAINAMIKDGIDTFIEISPHPVLSSSVENLLQLAKVKGLVLPSLRRNFDDLLTFNSSVARLFCQGVNLDSLVDGDRVTLPHYPFQREECWLESSEGKRSRLDGRFHPAISTHTQSPLQADFHSFRIDHNHRVERYLADHLVQGAIVVPGASHVDVALSCAAQVLGQGAGLQAVQFDRAFFLPNAEEASAPLAYLEVVGEDHSFKIMSRMSEDAAWTTHVKGFFLRPKVSAMPPPFPFQSCRREHIIGPFYDKLYQAGLQLGPTFRNIKEVRTGFEREVPLAMARIQVPSEISARIGRHSLHGAVLDACLQPTLFSAFSANNNRMAVYIPVGIGEVHLKQNFSENVLVCSRLNHLDDHSFLGDMWIYALDEGMNLQEAVRKMENHELALIASFVDFKAQYLEGSRQEVPLESLELESVFVLQDRALDKTHRRIQNEFPTLPVMQAHMSEMETTLLDTKTLALYEDRVEGLMNDLSHRYALLALQTYCVGNEKYFSLEHAIAESAHPDLLRGLVATLQESGHLQSKGKDCLSFQEWTSLDDVSAQAEGLQHSYPEFALELELLRISGEALPFVMSGKNDSSVVLFKPETKELLSRFYREGFANVFYNKLAAATVEKLVENWPQDKSLRILEIGAGTGGVTHYVLPLLPKRQTTYVFSDVSSSFFADAQKKFSAYDFLEFRELDIQKDPLSQNSLEAEFDFILASNALHTTSDMHKSLRFIERLLADNGRFMLLELTHAPDWAHLIFGLTKDWWNYLLDPAGRTSALMTAERWTETMRDGAFGKVLAATAQSKNQTKNQTKNQSSGRQHVFLAERNARSQRPLSQQALSSIAIVGSENEFSGNLFEICKSLGASVKVFSADTLESLSGFDTVAFVDGVRDENPDSWSEEAFGAHYLRPTENLIKWSESLNALGSKAPRFCILTAGVWGGAEKQTSTSLDQAPFWGIGRVLMNELGGLKTSLLDVSLRPSLEEWQSIAAELLFESVPADVVLRGTTREVVKVQRLSQEQFQRSKVVEFGQDNFQIKPQGTGNLDEMRIHLKERRTPGPSEIEVEVKASTLNFRDLMFAMNMMPHEMIHSGLFGANLGLECAGVVRRVGEQVRTLKVGDEVVGYTQGGLSGFTNSDERNFVLKPRTWSFAQAVTLPIAMGTAWLAIVERARLKKDDVILIHAAAGGVGLAAVQIARWTGARVFATAGSLEKREYLQSIGVEAVFDSRKFDFAEQILAYTKGRGVDVVLNSLAGKAMARSMDCLAPYGRFVEIGKTDIYDNQRMSLYPFRKNLSYFGVDLDAALLEAPQMTRQTLESIFALVEKGAFQPLHHKVFPVSKTAEAFRLMSRSAHIGKIVISMEDTAEVVAQVDMHAPPLLHSDKTYILTGGTGGVGLALAKWMLQCGARNLALLSPSGASKPQVREFLADVKHYNAKILCPPTDIGSAESLASSMETIRESLPPIVGVIHGAMILDDAPLAELSADRFEKVMRPKAIGAIEIHRQTLNDKLDFFIMLSSVSSMYGNIHQANYNAANVVLESLAVERQRLGLPGSAVQLGVVGGVGFVARNDDVSDALTRLGWSSVHINDLLVLLGRVMQERPSIRCLARAEWNKVRLNTASEGTRNRLSRLMSQSREMSLSDAGGKESLVNRIRGSESIEKQKQLICDCLGEELKRILAAEAAPSQSVPITDFGIDSLMATQLRTWIQVQLGIDLPMMQIMQGPSLQELGERFVGHFAESGKPGQSGDTSWILTGTKRSSPKIRLFCFPYMGGTTSAIYGKWSHLLPQDIEVCAVTLPGSLDRISEKPIEDFGSLIKILADELEPLTSDIPFIVYGHSQGALFAFEWLREMKRRNGKEAQHLFVGGYQAPHLPRPFREVEVLPETLGDVLPDVFEQQIFNFGMSDTILQDKSLRDSLWPGLKAGFRLSDSYEYQDDIKLNSAVTALSGKADRVFSQDLIAEWTSLTDGEFKIVSFEAGHLFVDTHRDQVLGEILNSIETVERLI